MARILQNASATERPKPWYLTRQFRHKVDSCNGLFELEESDFGAPLHTHPEIPPDWSILRTVRCLGGDQVIGGRCPCCGEYMELSRHGSE